MKIALGNDHGGTDLKWVIKDYLEGKGYEVVNYGTDTNESCDYPYYGQNAVTAGVEEVFGKGFSQAMTLLLIAFIVNILLVRFNKITRKHIYEIILLV